VTCYTIRPTQFLGTYDHLPHRLAEFTLRRLVDDLFSVRNNTLAILHPLPIPACYPLALFFLSRIRFQAPCNLHPPAKVSRYLTLRSGCFADMRPRTASTVTSCFISTHIHGPIRAGRIDSLRALWAVQYGNNGVPKPQGLKRPVYKVRAYPPRILHNNLQRSSPTIKIQIPSYRQ
jgi:hypothetical protein